MQSGAEDASCGVSLYLLTHSRRFNKPWLQASSQTDRLTIKLAPAFGKKLTKEAHRKMDHDLQVMIEAIIQSLNDPSHGELTWQALSAQMMRNSLLEPVGHEKYSTGPLIEDDGGPFHLQGVQKPLTIQAVRCYSV